MLTHGVILGRPPAGNPQLTRMVAVGYSSDVPALTSLASGIVLVILIEPKIYTQRRRVRRDNPGTRMNRISAIQAHADAIGSFHYHPVASVRHVPRAPELGLGLGARS